MSIVTAALIESQAEPALRIAVSAATSIGGRPDNEDAIFHGELASFESDESGRLLIIADGMGGYQGGEIASELAVATVRDNLGD